MQRYSVHTHPRPDLAQAWEDYLQHHLPEVVLAGRFAGGSLTRSDDGTLVATYDAPRGGVDAYLAGPAAALRADAEARFPQGVERFRRVEPQTIRVGAPFEWEALGLVDVAGRPVPCPDDGPFELAYVSPWCPDCETAWNDLRTVLTQDPARSAWVGIYASAAEVLDRAEAWGPGGVRVWMEPSAQDAASRLRSAHAWLRRSAADRRRWGVPMRVSLTIQQGRCVARWT